jgi:predicted dehydrogenase
MPAVRAVLIGAGNRGRYTYGAYARAQPDRLRIVAVGEPSPERRTALAREHGLGPEACFDDWKRLLESAPEASLAIVATSDTLHVEPALRALALGYHVLLEKPMALEAADCLRIVETAEARDRLLQISHVLRYTPFYRKVHEVLRSGALGELVHVDMKENVAFWHMTHSYVRGKFRNRRVAAPIVLAKTCHDLDLLVWFVDRPAERVASFGSLRHFRSESAPQAAPERCSPACPVQAECPHDAVRFYEGPDERVARLWPWSDVSADPSREARAAALESGPYGRCVYRCDNDVPDHQVVSLVFEGGLTAAFSLHGLASRETRTIRVTGTRGELRGVLQDGVIEVTRHGSFETERVQLEGSAFGHYGGDDELLDHFTGVVADGSSGRLVASGRAALESHLIGFAAERARETGRVVELDEIRAEARVTARQEGPA